MACATSRRSLTVLEALAILESATLECKRRDINTPEVDRAPDHNSAAYSALILRLDVSV